jgi:hypothetical protein
MEVLDTKKIEHNYKWRIINTSELKKFSDKIFEMYASSYKEIGLIDFGGWDGLAGYLNCSCYLLTDDDDDIHGIILYWLAEYGNKISLVISETPEIGKQYVIPKLIELIKTPGFFVELSDALEYLVNFKNEIPNIRDREVIKLLIPGLNDKDIFSEDDERRETYPLNKKKKIPSNEGSYLRVIKDIGQHRKALYGIPCLNKTFIGDGCNRKCNITQGGGKKSNRKPTRKYKKKSNRKPTRKSTKKSNRKPTRKYKKKSNRKPTRKSTKKSNKRSV